MKLLIVLIVVLTSIFALNLFPISGDEYSYLYQSQILSNGKLYMENSQVNDQFQTDHIIYTDKIYSKYTIGWPLILSIGSLLNAPWLINPILVFFVLYFLNKLGNLIYGKSVKNAALLMGTTPFFVLNAASYYPHIASMLFAIMFVYFIIKYSKEKRKLTGLFASLSIGVLFLIRPIDCLIVAIPTLVYLRKDILKNYANYLLIFIPFFVFLIITMLINWTLHQNPFVFGYQIYDSKDSLSFGNFGAGISLTVHRLFLGLIWMPTILVMLYKINKKFILPISYFLITILIFIFYPYAGGDQFGPRYYIIALPFLALIASHNLEKCSKKAITIFVIINLIMVAIIGFDIHKEVEYRSRPYEFGKSFENSIVFLNSSQDQGCHWYTRNDLHLTKDVLYACDGSGNSQILNQFPNRSIRYYDLALMGESDSFYSKTIRYS